MYQNVLTTKIEAFNDRKLTEFPELSMSIDDLLHDLSR